MDDTFILHFAFFISGVQDAVIGHINKLKIGWELDIHFRHIWFEINYLILQGRGGKKRWKHFGPMNTSYYQVVLNACSLLFLGLTCFCLSYGMYLLHTDVISSSEDKYRFLWLLGQRAGGLNSTLVQPPSKSVPRNTGKEKRGTP